MDREGRPRYTSDKYSAKPPFPLAGHRPVSLSPRPRPSAEVKFWPSTSSAPPSRVSNMKSSLFQSFYSNIPSILGNPSIYIPEEKKTSNSSTSSRVRFATEKTSSIFDQLETKGHTRYSSSLQTKPYITPTLPEYTSSKDSDSGRLSTRPIIKPDYHSKELSIGKSSISPASSPSKTNTKRSVAAAYKTPASSGNTPKLSHEYHATAPFKNNVGCNLSSSEYTSRSASPKCASSNVSRATLTSEYATIRKSNEEYITQRPSLPGNYNNRDSYVKTTRPSSPENTLSKISPSGNRSTRQPLSPEYANKSILKEDYTTERPSLRDSGSPTSIHTMLPKSSFGNRSTRRPLSHDCTNPVLDNEFETQRPSSTTNTMTCKPNVSMISQSDRSGNTSVKASGFMHTPSRSRLSSEYSTSEYLANKLSHAEETHAKLPSTDPPVGITTTPTDSGSHSPTPPSNYDYRSSSPPSLPFRQHYIINPSADKIATNNNPRAKSSQNSVLGHPPVTIHEPRSPASTPPILKQTQYITKPSSTPIIEEPPAMTPPNNIDLGRPPSPSSTSFKQHNAINPPSALITEGPQAVTHVKNTSLRHPTTNVDETIQTISPGSSARSSIFKQQGALNHSSPLITIAPTEMISLKNTALGSQIATINKNSLSSSPWPSRLLPNFISNSSYVASEITSLEQTIKRPSFLGEQRNQPLFPQWPQKRSSSPGYIRNRFSFTGGPQQRLSLPGGSPNRPSSPGGPQNRFSSAPPRQRSLMTSFNLSSREGRAHYTSYKYPMNTLFAGYRPVSLSSRPRSSGEVKKFPSSSSAPPSRVSNLKPSLMQSFYNNNPSILENTSKYTPVEQKAPKPRPLSDGRFITGATPKTFDDNEIKGKKRHISISIQTEPDTKPTSPVNTSSKATNFGRLSKRPAITLDYHSDVSFISESSVGKVSSPSKANTKPSVAAAYTTPASSGSTPKLSDEYHATSPSKKNVGRNRSLSEYTSRSASPERTLSNVSQLEHLSTKRTLTPENTTIRKSNEELITSSHYNDRASNVKPTRPPSPGDTCSEKSPSVRRSTRHSLSPDYTKSFSDNEDETPTKTKAVFLIRPSDRSGNTPVKASDCMHTSTGQRLSTKYLTSEYLARETHTKLPSPGPPVMITTTPTDVGRYSPIATYNYVYQRHSSPTKTNTSSNVFLIRPSNKSGNTSVKASDFKHTSTRPRLSLEYPTAEYLANKLSPPIETHAKLQLQGPPVMLTTTPTDARKHSPTESPNYDYQSSSSPSLIFREHGIINNSADKIAMNNHPRAKSPKNIVLGHPTATFHETRSLDSSPSILKQVHITINTSSTPIIKGPPVMTSPKNIDLERPSSKIPGTSSPSPSPPSTRFKQHNAINPSNRPSFTWGPQQRPSPQGRASNRHSSPGRPQKRSSSAPPIYRSSMTSSNHGWPPFNRPSKRFSTSSLAGQLSWPASSQQICR